MTQSPVETVAVSPLQTIHEIKPGSFIFEQHNTLTKEFCEEIKKQGIDIYKQTSFMFASVVIKQI